MKNSLNRMMACLLSVSLLGVAVPAPAQAALIETPQVVAAAQAEHDRALINALLDRPAVQTQLEGYGVSASDAKARVAAMSDEEVARVAGRVDQLPAGGDILGALLTVFVILLITDILGFTKVFSFTRPMK